MADTLSIKTSALIGTAANPTQEFKVGEKVPSLALTRTRGTAPVGITPGAMGMQASRFDVYGYTGSFMSTDEYDAVAHAMWGARAYVNHRETAATTAAFDGPVTSVTLTGSLSTDTRSWSFTVAVDGAPVEAAQVQLLGQDGVEDAQEAQEEDAPEEEVE